MDDSVNSRTDDGDSPLIQLFRSSGRTRIVEAFLGKRGTELTAAEVAKLAGVDQSTVSRNIDSLIDVGFIERKEMPSGVFYQADVDNPTVRALLETRRALLGVLAENEELVETEGDQDPATEAYVDRIGLVRLFKSPSRVKMIEAFLQAQDKELIGAEVADLAGINRSTVSRNIDGLLDLKIVNQIRRVGGLKLYHLNEGCPLVDALRRTQENLSSYSSSNTSFPRRTRPIENIALNETKNNLNVEELAEDIFKELVNESLDEAGIGVLKPAEFKKMMEEIDDEYGGGNTMQIDEVIEEQSKKIRDDKENGIEHAIESSGESLEAIEEGIKTSFTNVFAYIYDSFDEGEAKEVLLPDDPDDQDSKPAA